MLCQIFKIYRQKRRCRFNTKTKTPLLKIRPKFFHTEVAYSKIMVFYPGLQAFSAGDVLDIRANNNENSLEHDFVDSMFSIKYTV